MKLNNTNPITQFYKWSHGKSDRGLTKNFCTYFWGLVLATIFLPLTIWTYPVQRWLGEYMDLEDNTDWILAGRAGFSLGIFAGLGVLIWIGSGVYFYPITALIIVGIAGAPAVFFWAIFRKNAKARSLAGSAMEIVSEAATSTKERYCPRIEWTDIPEKEDEFWI